jgi:cellulose biosynthesis protein BcsQ
MLLGSIHKRESAIEKLLNAKPRRTVAGYLEARLNSPFRQVDDVSLFVSRPHLTNSAIPKNLRLICGDNLLEILSEAMRQTSQLAIPYDAWKQVISWLRDLVVQLSNSSDDRASQFFIDCNPSFAIYTQLALVAADYVVVPFTADDSSRRAVENVAALLYGVSTSDIAAYARISFSRRAKEEGISAPRLHTFVSNRQTLYEGKPSAAFRAANTQIKRTVDSIYAHNREIFANNKRKPSETFLEVPDYHSASIVASINGMPLHGLKAGPHQIEGQRIQINKAPLVNYRNALRQVVSAL